MKVTLLSFTPNPELLAAAAARLCYRDISAAEIMSDLTQEEVDHLLDITIESGHLSVVEHLNFSFAIDGVSRALTHQLVRHRVGIAFSQQSQRYATVRNASTVLPKTLRRKPQLREEFEAHTSSGMSLYRRLLDAGIPNEDARYVLPQAIETRLVMTVNLRELMHMYSLDACLRSQWEMRELMASIKRELRTISSRLASELKIKCFAQGYCDEIVMCDKLKDKMPRKQDLQPRANRYDDALYQKLAILAGEEEE